MWVGVGGRGRGRAGCGLRRYWEALLRGRRRGRAAQLAPPPPQPAPSLVHRAVGGALSRGISRKVPVEGVGAQHVVLLLGAGGGWGGGMGAAVTSEGEARRKRLHAQRRHPAAALAPCRPAPLRPPGRRGRPARPGCGRAPPRGCAARAACARLTRRPAGAGRAGGWARLWRGLQRSQLAAKPWAGPGSCLTRQPCSTGAQSTHPASFPPR